MTNDLVLQRLEGVRKALVAFCKSGAKIGKSTSVTGDEREAFVSHFLCQMLPPQYRIGSGVITDAQQHMSTQLDIVIELPFAPNFSFLPSTPRVYLADTIGAVIEVKSDLKGYLTGAKRGSAEEKLIIGTVNRTGEEKYDALKAIKRNVLVIRSVEGEPKTVVLEPSYTIPAYVVGYKGQEEATLRKHLDRLNRKDKEDASDVVRGILQLQPAIFVGSNGKTLKGNRALGAFINSLHWELHRTSPLSWPDLHSYFGI